MTGTGWTTFNWTYGESEKQLMGPNDIFVDNDGKIYLTDGQSHRIVRMDDMTGSGWMTFGEEGRGTNQFDKPSAVCIGGDGKLYIVDMGASRIVRIDNMTGEGWVTLGTGGSGEKQFSLPSDHSLLSLRPTI